MRTIKTKIKQFVDERWNVGFVRNDMASVLKGDQIIVDWVKHSFKDRWFADPFILDVTDDAIILLVEEFYKPLHRGRISKLIVDKYTFELKNIEIVLELPTHLSFPYVIRVSDDKVCLLPENGESGKLWLYEYKYKENRIQKKSVVLEDNVADAVPLILGKNNLLFCTKAPNPNGNKVCVYLWNEDEQKYIFSREISFKENIARRAGAFFEYDNRWYCPTQECNVQYGHAVTLQEVKCSGKNLSLVETIDSAQLEFSEVRRMYSVHPKLNVGMHTFNTYKGLIVIDALGFDNVWLRKVLKRLTELI